jgi:Tfp pilus assembly PilM family ATPase
MSHLLAVDWDQHETRYVLASVSGEKLRVQALAAVPLVDVVEGGEAPHPDVGNSLRAALAEKKVGRPQALVGVDRSGIELLHLTLPPAQDAELPDMVANQVMRDAAQVNEHWVIDFLPLSESPHSSRPVVATAMSPDQFQRILSTCDVAGLKPSRLLFRPLATASLVNRLASPPERVCLIVDRLTDEVDLIVVVEGKPVLLRTVRLPNVVNEDKALQRLLAEINRTAAVAMQNETDGGPVERVYLLGSSDKRNRLGDRITNQLFLPVTVVDPFDGTEISEELWPTSPGRFAPLVGMLLDEVHQGHAVDFLHPRKRPEPPNYRRLVVGAAALVLTIILGVGYFIWSGLAALDGEIEQLAQRKSEQDKLLKEAVAQKRVVDAIGAWQAGDVNWLDELRDLSQRLPPSHDMIVLRMTMSPMRNAGGSVDMQCLVRDPSIVVRMEQGIRDQFHQVRSKDIRQRGEDKAYTWQFSSSMYVGRREQSQYRPQPVVQDVAAEKKPAEKPADKTPSGKTAPGKATRKTPKSKRTRQT